MALLVVGFLVAFGCGESGDSEGSSTDLQTCGATADKILPTHTTWHWQLTGEIDRSVDVEVYDIDVFKTSAQNIAALKADGRFVICYFSAGTHENWRPDADQYDDAALGKPMKEWPDERWLDIRHASTREMVEVRLDLAVSKGCDGVEPDNMDGYANDTGFPLTGSDQIDFNRFVATQAHARGLSVGLKNDVDQLVELEPCYDWALNEECYAYNECNTYAPFLQAGKAVFHVEYVDDTADGRDLADDMCGDPKINGFSSLVKDEDLTEWYWDCL